MTPHFLIHQSTTSSTAFPRPTEKPLDMQAWLNRHRPTVWEELMGKFRRKGIEQ